MPLPVTDLPEPDVAALAQVAAAGLSAIPGCHRYHLDIARVVDYGPLGKEDESYDAEISVSDGVWGPLKWAVVSDERPGWLVTMTSASGPLPFMPPMRGAPSAKSSSFHRLVQDIGLGLTSSPEALWAEAGDLDGAPIYVLKRAREVDGGRRAREVLTEVWILPEPLSPMRWVATLDQPFYLSGDSGPRMDDVIIDLRVGPDGLPSTERFAARMRQGPMSLRMDQTTTFTRLGSCEAPPMGPAATPGG